MVGRFTAPQLTKGGQRMLNVDTHPAMVAHRNGASRPLTSGLDFKAYLVVLTVPPMEGEFIVTIWLDGDKGIQRV